ncbi:hypothetical protein BKA56DRAFT_585668 [Ilyonectria sp. MPI-CAGE-AT-0026]|nr:hypothetical protein BKA56DRAFT_585668 [Ilyonectria sp. MPI-CAGE-AT-0026]
MTIWWTVAFVDAGDMLEDDGPRLQGDDSLSKPANHTAYTESAAVSDHPPQGGHRGLLTWQALARTTSRTTGQGPGRSCRSWWLHSIPRVSRLDLHHRLGCTD